MRIDVEALNLDFFDDFVQLAGKRVQQASCFEVHGVAVEQQFGLHIAQAACEPRGTVDGFAVQFAFGVNRAVERKRRLQADFDRAGGVAPRRFEAFDVQTVLFLIITVGRPDTVEIYRLFFKIFADADFAGFQPVERYPYRQVYAFGQSLRRFFLLRRRRFGRNPDVARRQLGNVQAQIGKFARPPAETEAAQGDIRTVGLNQPVFTVKSAPQRAVQRFGRDFHAEPRRDFVQAETQPRLRPRQPADEAGRRQRDARKRQQQTAQPVLPAFRRRGIAAFFVFRRPVIFRRLLRFGGLEVFLFLRHVVVGIECCRHRTAACSDGLPHRAHRPSEHQKRVPRLMCQRIFLS